MNKPKDNNVQSSIATLDIEASGIHAHSYPIEVGISLDDGSSWCSLIKPADTWTHWDSEAEKIHGITRDELLHFGKSPREVASTLNEWLKNKSIYSDCWVLDEPWLIRLYEEAGISASFKLQDMMHILNEENYEQLIETKNTIAREMNIKRHRATNDAKILQLAYEKIIDRK